MIDRERFGRPQKAENGQFHELLNDNSTQTKPQLKEALLVPQKTTSIRLLAMGKFDKWVRHELNERQAENPFTCEILLQRHEIIFLSNCHG